MIVADCYLGIPVVWRDFNLFGSVECRQTVPVGLHFKAAETAIGVMDRHHVLALLLAMLDHTGTGEGLGVGQRAGNAFRLGIVLAACRRFS